MAILSVIILTRDEEIHIERAIRSVAPLAVRIFIVDSFSTDRTCEIARALGAEVVQHAFVNQAMQFQWALDILPIETDWVMRLDADEVLTEELVQEISRQLPKLPPNVTGVVLKLGYIFMGRKIVHGGRLLKLLRIFRKGSASIENRWMDEHIVLRRGRAVTFKHRMFDHNIKDISYFIDKHNSYATREAVEALCQKYSLVSTEGPLGINNPPTATKRWLKRKVYDAMPFWVSSMIYFSNRYFLQLGFLDGSPGLIYHFLQAFWYRFLVGAKIEEFDRALRGLPDGQARRAELARLSGLPLMPSVKNSPAVEC